MTVHFIPKRQWHLHAACVMDSLPYSRCRRSIVELRTSPKPWKTITAVLSKMQCFISFLKIHIPFGVISNQKLFCQRWLKVYMKVNFFWLFLTHFPSCTQGWSGADAMAEQHKSRGVDPCGWEALANIMPEIHQKSHTHSISSNMIYDALPKEFTSKL